VALARERYQAAVTAEQQRAAALVRVERLSAELDSAAQRLTELQREADVEQEEADRWSGRGFAQLVRWLFGQLDDRRELESSQAMAAAARLATAHEAWATIDQALREARSTVPPHADLAAALAHLRDTLEALEPHSYAWVVQCEQQSAAIHAELEELDEAMHSVAACSEAVAMALRHLRSAANWGTWDLLGGGLLASAVKRERVDEALAALGQVTSALATVRQELADIPEHIALPAGIEIGSGAWTFDVWFDNIFSDLNMQGRINDATAQAETLAGRLAGLHGELATMRRTTVDRVVRADAAVANALRGA
jgi:DNA repair exonuclease SbcCD ATPase subunit